MMTTNKRNGNQPTNQKEATATSATTIGTTVTATTKQQQEQSPATNQSNLFNSISISIPIHYFTVNHCNHSTVHGENCSIPEMPQNVTETNSPTMIITYQESTIWYSHFTHHLVTRTSHQGCLTHPSASPKACQQWSLGGSVGVMFGAW